MDLCEWMYVLHITLIENRMQTTYAHLVCIQGVFSYAGICAYFDELKPT